MRGVEAIKQKNKQWIESQDVHSVDVSGPFPHGDQFAVMYKFDATDRKSGKRYDMEEVALYTVKDDKIVKEEFFYKM
jgi:ketosteroid isomerase-like protein